MHDGAADNEDVRMDCQATDLTVCTASQPEVTGRLLLGPSGFPSTILTFAPRGPHNFGVEAFPNSTTVGVQQEAMMCIGPVSFPTATWLQRASAAIWGKLVFPASSTTPGAESAMEC